MIDPTIPPNFLDEYLAQQLAQPHAAPGWNREAIQLPGQAGPGAGSPISPFDSQGSPGSFGAPLGQTPQPLPPEDSIVHPDPNQTRTTDQRMEGYRRLLTNFTFSLGSGLSAASQNPRGRGLRTLAGMGAALQVPHNVQEAQQAYQERQAAQKLAQQKALIDAIQNKNTADYQQGMLGETIKGHALEDKRLNQDKADKDTDNALAQAKFDAEKAGYKHISTDNTGDGVVASFAPNNWDGKDPTKVVKVKIGPSPEKVATPKSVQNDEYLVIGGGHPLLSFDPTPTDKRPGGTYIDAKTGQDMTARVIGKYKPPPATNSAESAGYQFAVKEMDRVSKPVDEAVTRLGRLIDTVDQKTAIADREVAPELISVIAGGMGSGIRVTNAELESVYGGRPMLDRISSKLREWTGTNQKDAILWGDDERRAIHDLVNVVGGKLQAKQNALTSYHFQVSREGTGEQKRRDALYELERNLRAVDAGKTLVPDPTGRLWIADNPAQAAQIQKEFEKAAGGK